MYSIVIPTYNERDNVPVLVERIHKALRNYQGRYELWFIDDSSDDTTDILQRLSEKDSAVHYYHRNSNSGLGSAVVEGFAHASGKYLVVMDADLQHPPELLPVLFARLADGMDIVIPSRFVRGGHDGGLNAFRKLVSWTARRIGQQMLHRLRSVSDCTGGFFGVRRDVIEHVSLNPIGWKILIEVLVKGQYQTVHELPYAFHARDTGQSKMNIREQWNYLRHIWSLMWQSESDRRFYVFCAVGASGVIVNLLTLSLLLYGIRLSDVVASIAASLIAMLSNFIWNNRITWRDMRYKGGVGWQRHFRLVSFVTISSIGVAITTLTMQGLRYFNVSALVAQSAGIILATFWNYSANKRFTWYMPPENRVKTPTIQVTREMQTDS